MRLLLHQKCAAVAIAALFSWALNEISAEDIYKAELDNHQAFIQFNHSNEQVQTKRDIYNSKAHNMVA